MDSKYICNRCQCNFSNSNEYEHHICKSIKCKQCNLSGNLYKYVDLVDNHINSCLLHKFDDDLTIIKNEYEEQIKSLQFQNTILKKKFLNLIELCNKCKYNQSYSYEF